MLLLAVNLAVCLGRFYNCHNSCAASLVVLPVLQLLQSTVFEAEGRGERLQLMLVHSARAAGIAVMVRRIFGTTLSRQTL